MMFSRFVRALSAPSFKRRSSVWLAWVALLSSATSACSDEAARPCTVATDRQPRQRLPGGTTFYLGHPDEAACATLAWRLESAPTSSTNQVHVDSDGRYRLTPVVPGAYRLRLGDSTAVESLTVIDPATTPFHNYNYYPTKSLALVNDELWVANVFRSTISRVNPSTLEVAGEIVTGPSPVATA